MMKPLQRIGLLLLMSVFALASYAGENDLLWDYTEKNIPTSGSDNGLTYAGYVNDATGTNNGLHGVKLNSSGYAYFKKAAVAGKLSLTIGKRQGSDAYEVNVYNCSFDGSGKGTKGAFIGSVGVSESPGTGTIELGADVTGVWIERKTGSEGVIVKIAFKETVERSFVDFSMVLHNLATEFDVSTLPSGVSFDGTFNTDQHGYRGATITVPVDGTVKFTIGGCQYTNKTFTVTNSASQTLATLSNQTSNCYDQDNTQVVTYIYNGEPTTLTFNNIQYLPFFKAEATDVQEVTVTYKDQNGKVLGTKKVFEGDAIGEVPYTAADLTIPEGQAFRGWTYTSKIKVNATDIVNGDVSVNALVTPIESVAVGTVQTYDFTQKNFYPEDHETLNVTDGKFNDTQHGWMIKNGGSFTVDVAGNAQIVLTICRYGSANGTYTVTDANNNVIQEGIPAYVEGTDGSIATVNYSGEATKLTFTLNAEKEDYIHKVVVYNVIDFIKKDEATGYFIIPSGDGAGLILALNQAASEPNSKIFLPNGTYDFGETVLTGISGTNLSIIGESMEGVVVRNAPPTTMEGLGKADLFLNTGTGLYMQDLTLQNGLDYYSAGSNGRAPTLHDKGTQTVNYNVRHLSYQDTYYSNKTGGLFYFKGGELHGTVDFLCGDGKVYFDGVKIVNEKRSSATISANSELYVFNNCTVENNANSYNLGRAWSNNPVCIFLNTTLLDPSKLISTRWNLTGINCDYSIAGEYGTKNAEGTDITPEKNEITFTKASTKLNTILTADQAATYTIDYVLGSWAATAQAWTAQAAAPANGKMEGDVISWDAVEGATTYLIEKDGAFVALTNENSFNTATLNNAPLARQSGAITATATPDPVYSVRAANSRGGFGEAAIIAASTAIAEVNAAGENVAKTEYFNLAGARVNKNFQGAAIQVQKLNNGQHVAKKVILK